MAAATGPRSDGGSTALGWSSRGSGRRTSHPSGSGAPQTAAGIVATLLVGLYVDRVAPRWLLGGSMLSLAGGLAWGVVVTPGFPAVGFGLAIGSAGAAIRAFEAAAMPRFFGMAHVGALRGFIASVSVGSTAFGPLLFAVSRAAASYSAVLLGSALLPLGVLVAGFLARAPTALELTAR